VIAPACITACNVRRTSNRIVNGFNLAELSINRGGVMAVHPLLNA
jgi:hypothetical protein